MAPAIETDLDVSNLYVFISDALRWSALPKTIRSLGAAFKTVAASCATMRSVSSILTGRNPPRHGVATWDDRLSEPTLFDADAVTAGFHNPAAGNQGGLNSVLGRKNTDDLAGIKPPFVYVERDQGGHAPYHGYSYEEMLASITHTRTELRRHYTQMVEASAARFQQRLDTLSERELLDDTLVIFLGDHGELLGEYGLVSHSVPPTPELVYTPTVFIHPEIESGEQTQTIGHVDVAPTAISVLNSTIPRQSFDGVNLFSFEPGPRYNDAVIRRSIRGREVNIYDARGIWDGDGGHVFTKRGTLLSPAIGIKKARGWNLEYWISNPNEIPIALWYLGAPYRRHGIPGFSKSDAANQISEVSDVKGSAMKSEIDETTKERLQDLGYRT